MAPDERGAARREPSTSATTSGFQASSSTAEQGEWGQLPEELMLMVLDRLGWAHAAAVRLTCPRWRTIHDSGCKRLRLAHRATDEMAAAMCGRMPSLTKLDLSWSSSLTDEGVRAVAEVTSLTELNLCGCWNVTDDGVWSVAGLTALRVLNLNACFRLTDAGLRTVAGFTSLTHLSLNGCSKVTDEGLLEVASLTALTELYLEGCCSVTDAGMQHLSGCKKLTFLALTDCDTTETAEEELCQQQIPGLFIAHERALSDEDSDTPGY